MNIFDKYLNEIQEQQMGVPPKPPVKKPQPKRPTSPIRLPLKFHNQKLILLHHKLPSKGPLFPLVQSIGLTQLNVESSYII